MPFGIWTLAGPRKHVLHGAVVEVHIGANWRTRLNGQCGFLSNYFHHLSTFSLLLMAEMAAFCWAARMKYLGQNWESPRNVPRKYLPTTLVENVRSHCRRLPDGLVVYVAEVLVVIQCSVLIVSSECTRNVVV